jgi:hypothetical protein
MRKLFKSKLIIFKEVPRRPAATLFLRCIGWPHTAIDFSALVSLDHADVILALQVQSELHAVAEITAEPNRRLCGDCATAIEYDRDPTRGNA